MNLVYFYTVCAMFRGEENQLLSRPLPYIVSLHAVPRCHPCCNESEPSVVVCIDISNFDADQLEKLI